MIEVSNSAKRHVDNSGKFGNHALDHLGKVFIFAG